MQATFVFVVAGLGGVLMEEPAFREYQLAMLAPMCASAPAQAQAVLSAVDATRADAEIAAARRRWAIPASIEEYKAAWGVPDWEDVDDVGNGCQMRYARWDLTFWPDLQIELTQVLPAKVMFRQFVRRAEVSTPRLESLADLTPWSCTVGELIRSVFGPLTNVAGFGAIGDIYAFNATDPDSGRNRTYWAYLDWSLLQSFEPAPDDLSRRDSAASPRC
ncbi:hypothetical protein ACQPW1_18255 [Nocardia sp. CA-128927]|uniref:hypothetical protein n=1 Tax=Nocardia sp. CA-128927 TaxID=3239975 RepID=UPI003D9A074E